MLAKVFSAGIFGIDAYLVETEVDVTHGLPKVHLTGLADTAIKESRERVKTAIKNAGFTWPAERLTINLAPCSVKKEGGGFDLAIALGVLSASDQISSDNLHRFCVLGELSLDGLIRPVKGILPICASLKKYQISQIIVPWQNAAEASMVAEINVYPARSLVQAVELLNSPDHATPVTVNIQELFTHATVYPVDFSEVGGQFAAKRAITVACAGGHNLLMIGPPGCGKTMLAQRIPTILPPLTLAEALEVTKIHSAAGLELPQEGVISHHPFRQPHHTLSYASLVGGGAIPKPGEISLAHNGVLFLDELPEFSRNALAALRQPLEEGTIRISRMHSSYAFSSSFMLVCAMNPCKCGYYNDRAHACRCSTTQIYSYRSKISGPLLNRIDIHIELPPARYQELSGNAPAEGSTQIRERVTAARVIQQHRLQNEGVLCNAQMSHKQVKKFCALGKEAQGLLKTAMTELNLSARAYDKILKVSRTIADLAGSEEITAEHLAEAIQYRSLDRDFFI